MYNDTLFPEISVNELSEAILGYETPLARPTAATRWRTRSSLQKTIRRGSNDLAQRLKGGSRAPACLLFGVDFWFLSIAHG